MENKSVRVLLTVMVCLVGILLIAVVLLVGNSMGLFKFEDHSETFQQLITTEWEKSITEDQPEFLNKLEERNSFTLVDYKNEGDGYYTVELEVSAPDINDQLIEYQESITDQDVSEDEMNEKICEIIDISNDKTSTVTISIICDEDGVFHVNFTDEFVDAMTGYAFTNALETLMAEQ